MNDTSEENKIADVIDIATKKTPQPVKQSSDTKTTHIEDALVRWGSFRGKMGILKVIIGEKKNDN
jgi:hypothetical protein